MIISFLGYWTPTRVPRSEGELDLFCSSTAKSIAKKVKGKTKKETIGKWMVYVTWTPVDM